ncbi:MAG: ArsA family ATPase [Chloroflexi bacterium]|nr:ArsA family ATPase [Chloroflexota bacterium]
MRLMLFTGKGGVGKTSIAAATALRCAELGYRTVVMSTDAAHSLADSLDIPLSGEAREVLPNLRAQEVDVLRELDVNWGTLQRWIKAVLAWRGVQELVADEIAILPGMEELAGLLYILHHYDDPQVDVIIVDCAPTGETLRLLSFPDVLRWWLDRIYPIERQAARVLRPIASTFWNLPVPEEEVFDAVKELIQRLLRMRTVLTNASESSVRLVLNPEKMVVREAQRTFTYLNLYGYFTDLVVENRVIPDAVSDPFFDAWRESQRHYSQLALESFAPVPIRRVPLMSQEVVGLEMLRRVSDALYGDDDPTGFYFTGQGREFLRENGRQLLQIRLPFVEKGDIGLTQSGDELTVRVGNQQRNIILPHALAALEVDEAKLEDDRLRVYFRPRR